MSGSPLADVVNALHPIGWRSHPRVSGGGFLSMTRASHATAHGLITHPLELTHAPARSSLEPPRTQPTLAHYEACIRKRKTETVDNCYIIPRRLFGKLFLFFFVPFLGSEKHEEIVFKNHGDMSNSVIIVWMVWMLLI